MSRRAQREALLQQNEALCLQLQQNRRFIATKLAGGKHVFPRSMTMRLLTSKSTHDIVTRFSYAFIGVSLIHKTTVLYSFFKLLRMRKRQNRLGLDAPQP